MTAQDQDRREEAKRLVEEWCERHPTPKLEKYLMSGRMMSPQKLVDEIQAETEFGISYLDIICELKALDLLVEFDTEQVDEN
ncbi:hypothetical protein ACFL2D_02375 [Patescibacteria group bacterium]